MLSTFCGLLTIQVGVTVLAAVFLTLGAVILVANAFEAFLGDGGGDKGKKVDSGDDKKDDKGGSTNWAYYIIVAFAILLILIGILAFFSAYNESRCLIMLALLLLLLTTAFWVVMNILAFIGSDKTRGTLCFDTRCPESLWLANLKYKAGGEKKDDGRRRRDIANNEWFQSLTLETLEAIEMLLESIELNSLAISGCKECTGDDTKEEKHNSPCNWNTFWNMLSNSKKKTLSNMPAKKIVKRGINESHKMENRLLQNHSVRPSELGMRRLVNPLKITTQENKNSPKAKSETEHEKHYVKREDKGKGGKEGEGSSIDFGNPHFIAAAVLFLANLIFFLFSMLVFWSWAQELGSCDFDEFYYYY